jgi:hypothetical protein
VTTTTWWSRASRASRRPTSTAARPADAGVDLVEHHDRHGVAAGEHDLHRQHHPGQLAAGGAAVQGPRRGARVRGEQQLDVVDALRPGGQPPPVDRQPVGLLARGDRGGDLGVRHGQVGQLGTDGGAEAHRGLRARGRQRGRERRPARPRAARPGGELLDPVVVALQLAEPGDGPRTPTPARRRRRPRRAGAPARQDRQPLLGGGQPGGSASTEAT